MSTTNLSIASKHVRFASSCASAPATSVDNEDVYNSANYYNEEFPKDRVLCLAYIQLILCFFAAITQLIVLQLAVEYSKLSVYGPIIATEFFSALIFGLPGGIGIWTCRSTSKCSIKTHFVYTIVAVLTFFVTGLSEGLSVNFAHLPKNIKDPLHGFPIIFNVGQLIVSLIFLIIDGRILEIY